MTEDLNQKIQQMQAASGLFYSMARQIGCHPYIELCGIHNEYIKLCEQALKQGIDFTQCNAHTGLELPMKSYNVDYINEKLECIFNGRVKIAKE